MKSNNNDYVLILEDRTDVKNEQEVGTLSVVSGIDEAGKLNIRWNDWAKEAEVQSLRVGNKKGGKLRRARHPSR